MEDSLQVWMGLMRMIVWSGVVNVVKPWRLGYSPKIDHVQASAAQ